MVAPSGPEDDSYWALYSSVGGTADSTVPSPHLPKQELDDYGRPTFAIGLVGNDQQQFFACPPTATISRDEDVFLGVLEESVVLSQVEEEYQRSEADVEEPSEVQEFQELSILGLGLERFGVPDPTFDPAPPLASHGDGDRTKGTPTPDAGLRTAIQGIYLMWRVQNPGGTIQEFMAIVSRATEETSAQY